METLAGENIDELGELMANCQFNIRILFVAHSSKFSPPK